MESNTKFIAMRVRVEPRTQKILTMSKMIEKAMSSLSARRNDMIIFDNELKGLDRHNKMKKRQCQGKCYLKHDFS